MNKDISALILAAGKGTRMKSKLPKVLHKIGTNTLIDSVIMSCQKATCSNIVLVVGYQNELVIRHTQQQHRSLHYVHQTEQLGTGHAVLKAKDCLENLNSQHVLILPGDCPLIQAHTLQKLIDYHLSNKASATVLTTHLDDAKQYGRILRDNNQRLLGIREAKDCSSQELLVNEINSGIYCFNVADLFLSISKLNSHNKQGEYYLTDVIELLNQDNKVTQALAIPECHQVLGINSQEELAEAETILTNLNSLL